MLPGLLSLLLAITPLPNAAAGEVAAGAPHVDGTHVESSPAAASDGVNWLVVWSTGEPLFTSVHAMLVDGGGHPLLAHDILLDPKGIGDVAGVAWRGRYYLVVSGGHGGTEGVRVDAAGNVIDAKPFTIHPVTRGSVAPQDLGGTRRVAWDGTEFVVTDVLETVTQTGFVYRPIVSLVGEDGTIINAEVDLSGFAVDDIASLNGVTVLADDKGNVRTLSSATITPGVSSATSTGIAAGGGNFLLVGETAGGITGRFLDAAGHPFGVELPIASAKNAAPSVAWDGSSFVVIWTENRLTLRGARVRLAGLSIEPAFTIATDQVLLMPALASSNASVLALWSNTRIAASVVTENGSTAPRKIDAPAAPEIGPLNQGVPMLASAGNGSVSLFWSESSFGSGITRFERITDAGHTEPVDVATGSPDAVATGETASLVVQRQPSVPAIRAILLDANGRVTSTTDIATPTLGTFVEEVRAIAVPNGFLIAWVGQPTTTTPVIYAARIDVNGVATEAKAIGTGDGVNALAASGDRVLVVVGNGGALNGFLVASDLSSIPTDPIASVYDLPTFTSAASDGTNFLVSWISHGEAVANDYIAARRIDPKGHAIDRDHFIYSSGNNRKFNGLAFWTGENYEVIWTEPGQVWALRIGADGTLIDYPALHVADVPIYQVWTFAPIAGGRFMAAYARDNAVYTRTFGLLRRHVR